MKKADRGLKQTGGNPPGPCAQLPRPRWAGVLECSHTRTFVSSSQAAGRRKLGWTLGPGFVPLKLPSKFKEAGVLLWISLKKYSVYLELVCFLPGSEHMEPQGRRATAHSLPHTKRGICPAATCAGVTALEVEAPSGYFGPL